MASVGVTGPAAGLPAPLSAAMTVIKRPEAGRGHVAPRVSDGGDGVPAGGGGQLDHGDGGRRARRLVIGRSETSSSHNKYYEYTDP